MGSARHTERWSHAVAGETLSERELHVLLCIADDMTTKQIADEMNVSEATVSIARAGINAKLDVSSAAAAVAKAYHRGILKIPDQ
jgi:DNA-binding CsgD family transcriptional regulator